MAGYTPVSLSSTSAASCRPANVLSSNPLHTTEVWYPPALGAYECVALVIVYSPVSIPASLKPKATFGMALGLPRMRISTLEYAPAKRLERPNDAASVWASFPWRVRRLMNCPIPSRSAINTSGASLFREPSVSVGDSPALGVPSV